MKWQLSFSLVVLPQVSLCIGKADRLATIVSTHTAGNSSYEFIVVGGGISRLTVTDRLTEDPSSGNSTSLPSECLTEQLGEVKILVIWPGRSTEIKQASSCLEPIFSTISMDPPAKHSPASSQWQNV